MENVVERFVSNLKKLEMVGALNLTVGEAEWPAWQRGVVDVARGNSVRGTGVGLGAATVGRYLMHREQMHEEREEVVRAANRHRGDNPKHHGRYRFHLKMEAQ